jgi:hypothetical protein
MALAEGKDRHGASDNDLRNPRAVPRPLSSHVLHFLPSGQQVLHFPACRSHGCCLYRLNWIGHAPERMASGAYPQLFGEFPGLAVVGRVGAVRALEKDVAG